MEHLSDINLLDYVAGKLAGPESERARRHVAECPDCARRHLEVLETWSTLGKWHVDSAAHQVADRVQVLAVERKPSRRPNWTAIIRSRGPVLPALRIAAGVLLAIGGGHLLGRFTARPREPNPVISTEKPRYLAALGFEWSNELTWTVLEQDTQSGATQQ